jgi:hypothetical protein
VREVLRSDTDAVAPALAPRSVPFERNIATPACRRELRGIAQKIVHDLDDSDGIAVDQIGASGRDPRH